MIFSEDSVSIATSNTYAFMAVYKGKFTAEKQLFSQSPILGDVRYQNGYKSFYPLAPFQKETDYTLWFSGELIGFRIELNADFQVLQVESLYPNSDKLPANFLKWYVAFTKPINATNIYEHIHLIHTETNTEEDRALLPLETPLLSKDGKLLTLWIEPGRQKRNLGPNEHLGSVLNEGESYTLVIDKALKDIEGIPMKTSFEHRFTVTGADRIKPDITNWTFNLPKANTKDALVIKLNDHLDFGSLNNSLQITSKNGEKIDGKYEIDTNDQTVLFKPSNNWLKASYIITCNVIIEDVSGNNLERLFDRDISKESTSPALKRTFEID
ncbi:MAG: hypothetical protein ACWA5P_11720 [bacterium]